MPNDYFQFKQFRIRQANAGMKVCTDACLFGAWVAAQVDPYVQSVLDIGTGTGLLALMVAQKTNGNLTAIDIEKGSLRDAEFNFSQSPWAQRITLIGEDARLVNLVQKFNLVICNPPFFRDSLKSKIVIRNVSMHEGTLSVTEVINLGYQLSTTGGLFAIMVPAERRQEVVEKATQFGLFPREICEVRQTPNHPFFRTLFLFQKARTTVVESELCIKNEHGEYSREFRKLLRDYYLAF